MTPFRPKDGRFADFYKYSLTNRRLCGAQLDSENENTKWNLLALINADLIKVLKKKSFYLSHQSLTFAGSISGLW